MCLRKFIVHINGLKGIQEKDGQTKKNSRAVSFAFFRKVFKECVVEIHRNSPFNFLRPKPWMKFTTIYRRNVVEILRNSPSKLLRM